MGPVTLELASAMMVHAVHIGPPLCASSGLFNVQLAVYGAAPKNKEP